MHCSLIGPKKIPKPDGHYRTTYWGSVDRFTTPAQLEHPPPHKPVFVVARTPLPLLVPGRRVPWEEGLVRDVQERGKRLARDVEVGVPDEFHQADKASGLDEWSDTGEGLAVPHVQGRQSGHQELELYARRGLRVNDVCTFQIRASVYCTVVVHSDGTPQRGWAVEWRVYGGKGGNPERTDLRVLLGGRIRGGQGQEAGVQPHVLLIREEE